MFLSITNIKTLANLVLDHKIQELTVWSWGRKIRIRKPNDMPVVLTSNPNKENLETAAKEDKPIIEIKSEGVGLFLLAPSPSSTEDELKPLSIGERIKKGQNIYAIRAMNIPAEYKSEVDGTIIEITVKEEQKIQFGQVLFLIDPN